MVPIAALGGIFPRHPFDLIYNYRIRYLTGTQPLPRNRAPSRFACGMAAVGLVGTALAFGRGVAWLGYLLGGMLTVVAAIVSITHFCIPSTIYQFLFGRRGIQGRMNPMSGENKALADRFHMGIFQEGDLAAGDDLLSSDFHWHGGMAPSERGPAGVKQVASMIIAAFPDRQTTHHDAIAEGDKVLIRWSMTGTHNGDLMGLAPTGKRVTVTGFDYFRISGGKIVEMWQEVDQLGMMQQLGVIAAPG
jgi:predicted ester cyclase